MPERRPDRPLRAAPKPDRRLTVLVVLAFLLAGAVGFTTPFVVTTGSTTREIQKGDTITSCRATANAAVTVVHTGVPDWPRYTREAEILIAAAGVPGIIQPEHVRPGAVVIGGGVRYEGRRLLPDVDESCAQVAGAITPRVGGVGPTTVAMLFRNAIAAAERATAGLPATAPS